MATRICLQSPWNKACTLVVNGEMWLRRIPPPKSSSILAMKVMRNYSLDKSNPSIQAIAGTIQIPDRTRTLDVRLPRGIQAAYLRPLKQQAQYGFPSCDLQMRSYSARNLEFYADFAMRAAYFLGLAARGPVPLPRIVERWTVPRASFIYKKSQENFERKTLRRLIQIQDGHPGTVQIWLAFLRKHAYYGIGMKANLREFSKLEISKTMDAEAELFKSSIRSGLARVGVNERSSETTKPMELIIREDSRAQVGGNSPMMKAIL